MSEDYDVVISGASVAGCAAAAFLAGLGARVALLEKRSTMDAYKVLCTHTLQPSCIPVVKTLGLMPALEAAGAVPHVSQWWTKWGWIKPGTGEGQEPLPHGLNIRRQTLDPLLRRFAADTPGVDLRLGASVTELISEHGRVVGVRGSKAGKDFEIRAKLVVGADGRHSTVADLAKVETTQTPNNRLGYFAHFRNLPLPDGDPTRIWFLDPDTAYCIPNDDGVTVVAVTADKAKHLADFKADLDGAFRAYIRSLPDAPRIDEAEQVSKIIGTIDLPLVRRTPVAPGVALIGDAAIATDPLWGVGCAWALQSAQWLSESVGTAVAGSGDLDAGLVAYQARHRAELGAYQHMFESYASARPFNFLEKLMFSSAARNDGLARHNYHFASRLMGVKEFLAPKILIRAAAVNASHGVGKVFSRS